MRHSIGIALLVLAACDPRAVSRHVATASAGDLGSVDAAVDGGHDLAAVPDLAVVDFSPADEPRDLRSGPDLNPCECWGIECNAEWHGDMLVVSDMCRRRPLDTDAGEVCYCF